MKLTILGTGNAMAKKCYNTCFVLEEECQCFLVDGGGGNGILTQLDRAGIELSDIHDIFVTHKHMDHILGVLWITRAICQAMLKGKYSGDTRIYGHEEVISLLKFMASSLLTAGQSRLIGERIQLIEVSDGEEKEILGRKIVFFDICSTKAKQFGFRMGDITCCGDEPYNQANEKFVKGSRWLLHEAFCLDSEADEFKPYEKHHSTVKDACMLAQKLDIPNLILYHTEDKNIDKRKELYSTEGKRYYGGNLYVPDDMEIIDQL